MYSFRYNSENKCFWTHVDMDIFSCFDMWNSFPEFVCTFQLHSVHQFPQYLHGVKLDCAQGILSTGAIMHLLGPPHRIMLSFLRILSNNYLKMNRS
jgi:hypothetical protein